MANADDTERKRVSLGRQGTASGLVNRIHSAAPATMNKSIGNAKLRIDPPTVHPGEGMGG
jgi:hypothetical protein